MDLFPFWQKYFATNATKESVLKDLKQQKSEIKGSDWWMYKFQADDDLNPKIWTLRKFY